VTTHIDTSYFLSLLEKQTHKNIRKGSKKKEKRKGEEILKIFKGTSLLVLSSFDLVFPIFIFLTIKIYFSAFFSVYLAARVA